MLKSKEDVCLTIKPELFAIPFDKHKKAEFMEYLLHEKDLPSGIVMDYMTQRLDLESAPEFILYCLSIGLAHIGYIDRTNKWFSESEIRYFSSIKYQRDKLTFPITIPCMQVTHDQWIGAADVQFLMQLRNAQMISYNENAQRTLTKKVRNGDEYWTISLNRYAVNEIREMYSNNSFIPNTITLCVPEYSDANFYYKNNSLVFNSIDKFDISDGYHRYIAMCNEYDLDNNFNYPVELRVIHFSDEKTRHFIFQEDKKTKMSKMDSESMNINKASNIIVERLNHDITGFALQGEISRNNGNISFSSLSAIVDYVFCKHKNITNKDITVIEKRLCDVFNKLCAEDDSYFTHRFEYCELFIIVLWAAKQLDLEHPEAKISDTLRSFVNEENNKLFKNTTPRTAQVNAINRYLAYLVGVNTLIE